MPNPSDYAIIENLDDVLSLSQVASDIRRLFDGEGASQLTRLQDAPLFDGWCQTRVSVKGIIGLSGAEHPASLVTQPIFMMSTEHGWARTLHGWIRLGRHISEML